MHELHRWHGIDQIEFRALASGGKEGGSCTAAVHQVILEQHPPSHSGSIVGSCDALGCIRTPHIAFPAASFTRLLLVSSCCKTQLFAAAKDGDSCCTQGSALHSALSDPPYWEHPGLRVVFTGYLYCRLSAMCSRPTPLCLSATCLHSGSDGSPPWLRAYLTKHTRLSCTRSLLLFSCPSSSTPT